jgi:hypothetical protein
MPRDDNPSPRPRQAEFVRRITVATLLAAPGAACSDPPAEKREDTTPLCEVATSPALHARYSADTPLFRCDLRAPDPVQTSLLPPVLVTENDSGLLQLILDRVAEAEPRGYRRMVGGEFERLDMFGQQLVADGEVMTRDLGVHDSALLTDIRITIPLVPQDAQSQNLRADYSHATILIKPTEPSSSWEELRPSPLCEDIASLIPSTREWLTLAYLAEAPEEDTWLVIARLLDFGGTKLTEQYFVFYGTQNHVQQREIQTFAHTQDGSADVEFLLDDEVVTARFPPGCPELQPGQICEGTVSVNQLTTPLVSHYASRDTVLSELALMCQYVIE